MEKEEADVKAQAIRALPQNSTVSFHEGIGGTQIEAYLCRIEQKGENPKDCTKIKRTTCYFT